MAYDVAEGAAARDGSRLTSIFATAAINTDVEDSAAGSIAKKLCMDPLLELNVLELPHLLVPQVEFSIACWKSLHLDPLLRKLRICCC